MIELHDLRCRVGRHEILRGVELRVARGEVLGLLGENGAGKSTLLRCVARLRPASGGRVLVGGLDVRTTPARILARKLAILLQELPADLELAAAEVVALARLSGRGFFSGPLTAADRAAARDALALVGAADLAGLRFDRLSGGERQRVMIARVLAQEPEVLLLDEPINHLDVRHQLETLAMVRRRGLTVLAALHELNIAAAFCDRLAVLKEGRIAAIGTPAAILTPALIARAFAVRAGIDRHPFHGGPRVSFSHPLSADERRSIP
ncbi:MAG: ABC transporter ATP-binding protein [Geminicoccaceae bacterium]